MKIIVKLTEAIVVSFDSATAETTAAKTLIVRNADGEEIGMYPAGTYLEFSEE